MSSPVSPGDVLLGKYRVERVLGRGGMGVVVAARHLELGELFAIKFLLPDALAYPQATDRFLLEARASARIKGEHVVKVQDVGRLPDGLPYMVMEHLSGSDLKGVVRQRGPLPVAEAVIYVLQACEALAEAHSLGIVHRDLKPANMFLIRRPNGAPCVKVLDFGISKQLGPEDPERQVVTQTGVALGSPAYMSPEQILRTKEADPRSDIWSMGVVLYQLLTGKVPFQSEAMTELIGRVLQEEPEPPSRHRPDLPPAIDAVVMTCLQKAREKRFQTTLELMAALRAALDNSSYSISPAAPSLPPAGAFAQHAGVRPASPAAGPAVAAASVPAVDAAQPLQPSQPVPVDETVTLPRPVFPSIPEHGGAAARGSMPIIGAGGSSADSPAAKTGQAWGATQNRVLPRLRSKEGYIVAAAALVLVLVGFTSIAALWQHHAEPSAATAETSSTPQHAGSSSAAVAPSEPRAVPSAATATVEPASASAGTGAGEPPAPPPSTPSAGAQPAKPRPSAAGTVTAKSTPVPAAKGTTPAPTPTATPAPAPTSMDPKKHLGRD